MMCEERRLDMAEVARLHLAVRIGGLWIVKFANEMTRGKRSKMMVLYGGSEAEECRRGKEKRPSPPSLPWRQRKSKRGSSSLRLTSKRDTM